MNSMVGRLSSLSLALLFAAGCSDDTSQPVGPGEASVVLSRKSVKMLTNGTVDVDATPLINGQLNPSATVVWSSSNTAVATVSTLGVVTTLTPGTVFIRAQSGGASDSMRLEVATATFDTVAAGGSHTCALTTDGEAYCWGENFNGALGTGDTLSNTTPLAVSTPVRFASLAVSQRTTCGLSTDGAAFCWGSNGSGQLGLGGADTDDHPLPAAVVGGLTFTGISAGASSTCGIAPGGVGYCWGSNVAGLLGDARDTDAAAPSPVAGGLTFSSVIVGQGHACAIAANGDGYCWGEGSGGVLGNGVDLGDCGGAGGSNCTRTPVAVTGGLKFAEVSASGSHTCAITLAEVAYCWGVGAFLGNGSTGDSNVPVLVTGGLSLHGITTGNDVADADNAHSCAIASSGVAYCWGSNTQGQLGTGAVSDGSSSPVAVSGGLTFLSLTAAANYSCGRTPDGLVYCWGTGSGSLTPAVVPGQS